MRIIGSLIFLFIGALGLKASAQELPPPEAIQRQSADGVALAADYYPSDADAAPVILALHMLNSQRSAYAPLIPDLRAAGYAILNIDMRGHGASAGSQDWGQIQADLPEWVAWLEAKGQLPESGLAVLGASIGANVALLGCADVPACKGAIALSPGLDYRGVQPEGALAEGLTALLVAAQGDVYSANSVRQLFGQASGAVSARLYSGRAHGTRLFDSDYASISRLILQWLAEHAPLATAT